MSVPSSILLSRLGPVAGQNYKDRIESMRNGRYTDYRILGSIGLGAGIFSGIKNVGRDKMYSLSFEYADNIHNLLWIQRFKVCYP